MVEEIKKLDLTKQPLKEGLKKSVEKVSTESVLGGVKQDKKWIVALLLSILVGNLGVDRFYMGYIWQGILKLITFGGLGIWWIIDLILIATKYDFGKVNWVE